MAGRLGLVAAARGLRARSTRAFWSKGVVLALVGLGIGTGDSGQISDPIVRALVFVLDDSEAVRVFHDAMIYWYDNGQVISSQRAHVHLPDDRLFSCYAALCSHVLRNSFRGIPASAILWGGLGERC